MNDQELERQVARALHELYPESVVNTLVIRREPHRRAGRGAAVVAAVIAVAAVSVVVALLQAGSPSGSKVTPGRSAAAPAATTSAAGAAKTSAPRALPAWAKKCLPAHAVRSASQFVGLSLTAADTLAKSQSTTLFVLGMQGHCQPRVSVIVHGYAVDIIVGDRDRVLAAFYERPS